METLELLFKLRKRWFKGCNVFMIKLTSNIQNTIFYMVSSSMTRLEQITDLKHVVKPCQLSNGLRRLSLSGACRRLRSLADFRRTTYQARKQFLP
jgi:hypothetical protein